MILSRVFSKLSRSRSLTLSLLPTITNSCSSSRSLCTKPCASEKEASNPTDDATSRPPLEPGKLLPSKDFFSRLRALSEIPWQVKIANTVQLIGTVAVPVQVTTSKDGVNNAVTVLVQEKSGDLSPFWIPIIFQGDLAEIAAWHLKENQTIYVTGQLSGDAPKLEFKDGQSNLQVIVHSMSFVLELLPKEKGYLDIGKKPKGEGMVDTAANSKKSLKPDGALWSDLVANSKQWLDCRMHKVNGKVKWNYPDFKHKNTKIGLWLADAPAWVHVRLDELVFGMQEETRKDILCFSSKKIYNYEEAWKDLVENPSKWWDNRLSKFKPNHPDFKHKETGNGLWLTSSTPAWVISKLPPTDNEKNKKVPPLKKES